ncbi:MAG: S8 family serine peptidase [Candidatus Thiodiazotropha sp. (ex Troendleina suluensis)]|nr:S8 family serine peptidase [Candidatus Thiodiazotropha sp. (ex Troendleina suluensis)]
MNNPLFNFFYFSVYLFTLGIFFVDSSFSAETNDDNLSQIRQQIPQQQHPFADSTDRIIIKYKSNEVPSPGLNEITLSVTESTGENFAYVKESFNGAQIIKLDEKKSLEEIDGIIQEIRQFSQVMYVEPDLMIYPLYTPNDSRYSEQWHFFEDIGGIRLSQAWDSSQGENTVVAVVDSGYRPHQDLLPNILPGYDMVSDLYIANDGNGRDSDAQDPGDYAPECNTYISKWHGTQVAGIVAAVADNNRGVAGTAFQARLLPVRVIGRCGGYLSDIADGIIWASGANLAGRPVNQNPANVINLSLGGEASSCPQTMAQAIDIARLQGATIVAAAGNSAQNISGITPANCDGVIAVAASTRAAAPAVYSNHGSAIDVSAPGEWILSTHNSGLITPGNDTYTVTSGTSMSAPQVSGVAALLYAIKPNITPDEVEQIIRDTARPFPVDCTGCGSGILDASAAVAQVGIIDPVDPALILLQNGIPETGLFGDVGSMMRFAIDIPVGANDLSFVLNGGNGDADLYVQFATEPSLNSFDCRPYLYGNSERCRIRSPQPGRYYVMVHGYSAFSDANLVANYFLENNTSDPNSTFENQSDIPIPDSALNGVSSPITVTRVGESGQIDISIAIRHPAIREILVELIDPNGGIHSLKSLGGYNGEDFIENIRLNLATLPSQGIWNLRVKDFGVTGIGYIDNWQMRFP